MASKQISIQPWEPSPSQVLVAEKLKMGMSQRRAAEVCGFELRTIQRWWATQEFRAYVFALQRELLGQHGPVLGAMITRWQEIQAEVADGKRHPDEAQAQWAERNLKETLHKVYVARIGGL